MSSGRATVCHGLYSKGVGVRLHAPDCSPVLRSLVLLGLARGVFVHRHVRADAVPSRPVCRRGGPGWGSVAALASVVYVVSQRSDVLELWAALCVLSPVPFGVGWGEGEVRALPCVMHVSQAWRSLWPRVCRNASVCPPRPVRSKRRAAPSVDHAARLPRLALTACVLAAPPHRSGW